MKNSILTWHNGNVIWLSQELCLYVLLYQRLKTDLRQELLNLATFLGVATLSEEHLQCVLENAEGNFKRPAHDHPPGLYTDHMNRTIDAAIMSVMDMVWTVTGVRVQQI